MGGPVENLLRAAGCPLYAVPKALGFDVEAQRSAAQVEADNARGCVAPCWDETDNGIPDVCLERRWCPFNPDNPVTNDNFVCLVFGNIGFPYFDRRRKVYMGVAMWSTLLAMFVTAFGALSLSTDPDIVRTSYWAKLETWNATSRETTHYYLGLRSIVTVYDGGDETTDRLEIDYMVGRIPGSRDVDPMREALLESCADSAAGNQIGALLSCVTLIFALLGTINRMRFSSDANVQKALGLVTDTWGALTLSYTLFNFHANCFDDLPNRFLHLDLDYEWGPGWICYLFCALSGCIRAAAHWVTPTPSTARRGKVDRMSSVLHDRHCAAFWRRAAMGWPSLRARRSANVQNGATIPAAARAARTRVRHVRRRDAHTTARGLERRGRVGGEGRAAPSRPLVLRV